MSLGEEITEEIVDIHEDIDRISQMLAGTKRGCIEEALVLSGIREVLEDYHGWDSMHVQEIYQIDIEYVNGGWDVRVGPKCTNTMQN